MTLRLRLELKIKIDNKVDHVFSLQIGCAILNVPPALQSGMSKPLPILMNWRDSRSSSPESSSPFANAWSSERPRLKGHEGRHLGSRHFVWEIGRPAGATRDRWLEAGRRETTGWPQVGPVG